jgi:plastocyanin
MSKRSFAVLPLVLASVAAVLAVAMSSRAGATREVALVARGMAFYLEGGTTPNPTIHVRAGEAIRLVLRNDTPGLVHDLAVEQLGIAIAPLKSGALGSVSLQLPHGGGTYEYVCRPHAQMMRGRLHIAPE